MSRFLIIRIACNIEIETIL